MHTDLPLPDAKELNALLKKARRREPFTNADYDWIANVLAALGEDPMYRLMERMKVYEAEDHARGKKT